MRPTTSLHRWLTLLLVAALALPLALLASRARAFGTETRLSDTWFRTRPRKAPRPDFLVVARDTKTLDELGRPGHATYAALIRKLKAAGARWIVLDLDLDDRQGKAADRDLWMAIEESHRTLVMVRYAAERTGLPDKDELRGLRDLERSSHWQRFAYRSGTPEFSWLRFAPTTSDFIHSAHGAGVAVTETSADPDGVLRRSRAGYVARVLYPADTKQGKLTDYYTVVPSLPVIAAVSVMGGDKYALDYRFGDQIRFGGAAPQPLDVRGFVPIDYIGPDGSYPRVSMADVLRDRVSPETLRNRVVFVGSTVPGEVLSEFRPTPFGSPMPRVEITANQTQAFLEGRSITPPYAAGLWGVMAFGLCLGVLVSLFRPAGAVLAALGGLLLYLGVGWVLFGLHSVMLPLLPALILTPLAMVAAAALNAWLHPYDEVMEVQVRDTGMALGPDEPLPGTARRRWPFYRRPRGLQ